MLGTNAAASTTTEEQADNGAAVLTADHPLETLEVESSSPKPSSAPQKRYLWNFRGFHFGPPWISVVGSFLCMLGLGVFHSWGTLSIFVSDPGLLWSYKNTATIWCYAIGGVAIPLAMFLSTPLQKKFGFMVTTMIGSVLGGAGLMLSGMATSIYIMLLTYGLMLGSGVGFGYVCCVATGQKWFPKSKGLVSGIVISAFGGGSFLFNLIIKNLSNPNKVTTKPPTDPAELELWRQLYHAEMKANVPKMFIVVGILMAVLSFIGALTLHLPKEDESSKSSSNGEGADIEKQRLASAEDPEVGHDEHTAATPAPAVPQVMNLTSPQMLRTPQFWMLAIAVLLSFTAGVMVLGSFAEFAKKEATFEAPFDIIGGFAALSNAAGRVGWGRVADYIDYRRVYMIVMTFLSFLLAIYFETRKSMVFYAIITCLIFSCYGGIVSVLPTATSEAFGPKNMSQNYSLLFLGTSFCNILQAVLLNVLLATFGTYRFLFYLTSGLAAIGAVIMLIYHPPGRGKWCALRASYKQPQRT